MATTTARTPADLRPRPHHRGLLVDHDGTLVDSQLVNYLALRDALAPVGLTLDQDWFDQRTGVSTGELVAALAAERGVEVPVATVTAARNRAYLARVHEVEELAPVADLVRATRGSHRAALATGGQAVTVLPTLEALGLLPLLDAVVTRDDVRAGKPSPEIFLLAARRLALDPARCLVLEDSDEGLEAARVAGIDAVDVRPLRAAHRRSSR